MLALLFRQVDNKLPTGRSIGIIHRCWLYCLGRLISLRYYKQKLALLFRQVHLPQL